MEKAGAFENLKVRPERERLAEKKPSFWKQKENYRVLSAFLILIAAWIAGRQIGEESLPVLLLYGTSMVVGGYTLFKKGLKNLLRFEFDMNTLMTVAVLGAAAIGEWGEGAVVIILFAISEALETYSMDKARQSIRSLMDIAPQEALIRRGGQELYLAVEEIQVGDIMVVKPGQKIAMDGIIINGESSVNQAAITGESLPVLKILEDEVFAGTLNEEGLLEVRITKRSEDTTLAKIIHLVEEAQAERAPSQAFIDRFAYYYTPAIMLFALALAVIPPLFGAGWSEWIYRGLTVLVVGCPCALVISTPVSIVTAIGNAAKNGVLIKGGIHLEEAGAITSVAFDKTGTLTRGIPKVTDIISLGNKEKAEVLKIAAAMEKNFHHPLASAITKEAEQAGIRYATVKTTDISSLTGQGIKAKVNQQWQYIGSPALFEQVLFVNISSTLKQQILTLQQQGKTVVCLGDEQEISAIIAIADQVRETSKAVIQKLHNLGIQSTVMLTGDNHATAQAIGRELGVHEVRAELMPQEKLLYVKHARNDNQKIAMVGDGVNDAPALAAANVGIAMGGAGTDTALETADIALMADDLEKLPFTITLSRRALTIIKQNIAFAIGIKLLALILVVPGWLTLWMAIFADMGATLLVTLNGLRLLRNKKTKNPSSE